MRPRSMISVLSYPQPPQSLSLRGLRVCSGSHGPGAARREIAEGAEGAEESVSRLGTGGGGVGAEGL